VRLFSERLPSLPHRAFCELGTGPDYPAEVSPDHSRQLFRSVLLLFFAIAIAMVVSVAAIGSWRSANSAGKVQFPPVEWGSQPPLWVD
jgi:hypothetical protein